MGEEREIAPVTEPVHLSFSEQRQPVLRGERRHYLLARGDPAGYDIDVARLLRPAPGTDDFALDVERIRGISAPASGGATFAVRVENIHNGRTATYLGGPGRAWVAEFLVGLTAGDFGQP